MASGYALPTTGGSHHVHSHSYSDIRLSPGKAVPNGFASSNGHLVKKAGSNNSLYTHAETSRETSPIHFPNADHHLHDHSQAFTQNAFAFPENGRIAPHKHTHSWSPMKSRPRGESDLGKPAESRSSAYKPTLESIPAARASWFSLPEALTSLLIPLPYLLASSAYSVTSGVPNDDFPPLSAYAPLQPSDRSRTTDDAAIATSGKRFGFVETGIITSGTLLVVGILAKMQSAERAFDRGKGSNRASLELANLLSASSLQSMATRALSLGLPFYASMVLGGTRTGLVLLVAIAANLTCSDVANGPSIDKWKHIWSSKVATSVVMILSFITDEIGLTVQTGLTDLILGYLALTVSMLVLPPPLPTLAAASVTRPSPKTSAPLSGSTPWSKTRSGSTTLTAASPLICSAGDADLTLISGFILALTTILASTLLSTAPTIGAFPMLLITLAVASMASSIIFSQPSTIRSQSKAGLALGCLVTASCSFLFSPSLWPGTVCNGGLSALSFLGVLYDTNGSSAQSQHHEHHDHAHNNHSHHHHNQHTESSSSALTKFIMQRCEPGSLVHSILSEKDSRRIAYFTVLNFGFMIVQGAYGYLSGSLGLLSDTVHMFFDCLGLIVGLGAAVASKWPTSPEKPYGWGKLNTLAGFGNGIFLMLVSVEFIWEAIEGMMEGKELRHVQELLVVSTLGLLVNLVGLFAFGHAHAGHDHGHSHGHSHQHSHDPPHSHGHHHGQNHANGHAHNDECNHGHEHKAHASHESHNHQHNENMHGIFLHVAADAGGSLAVIISTALTLWQPWYLWDPLATILIAVLIFAAAVPLVTSSGQKLLLVIPDELEYNIKNTLQELGELRGVVGYAVPRFWIDDKEDAGDSHGHHHHGHDHGAHSGSKKKVMGVIHIIAAPSADLEDVRERVQEFVADRNMDILIHVEREAEGQCWCGGGAPQSS